MKNFWILPVSAILLLMSCKNSGSDESTGSEEIQQEEMAYSNYGEAFSAGSDLTAREMEERYRELNMGDTLEVSFVTRVTSVCKNKGCWMTLELPEEEEDVMVKFKDYAFFVPKDIEQSEVIVHGKAYVTEVPVDEQRHYAEDKGATKEEIAAIVQPKRTLSFLADGVLIKE